MRRLLIGLSGLMMLLAASYAALHALVGSRQVDAGLTASAQTAERFPVRRCMNMGASLERPIDPGGWGYEIEPRFFARIRHAGFDSVRLPMNWDVWQSRQAPFAVDPGFTSKARRAVDAALAEGLTVIINVHWNWPMMANPSAEQPRFRVLWQHIAETFRDYPDELIFELFNEPSDRYRGAALTRSMTEIISDVRRTHPNRWLVVPTEDWSSWSTLHRLPPPRGARLAVGVHDYDPFEFTHQGAEWFEGAPKIGQTCCSLGDDAEARRRAATVAQWSARTGVPVVLGEFGAYDHASLADRASFYAMQRAAYEGQGIGWCAWGFAGGFNIYDLGRDDWIRPILDALIPQPGVRRSGERF